MKLVLLITLLFAIALVRAGREIKPRTADDILQHLQGNNYNIYLIYFYESSNRDEKSVSGGQDIQKALSNVIDSNPELFSAKVDLSDREFSRLGSVVGLNLAPAVLMIVHGKGVWLSGTNANLMMDRLRDFMPAFKQASAHHSNPY